MGSCDDLLISRLIDCDCLSAFIFLLHTSAPSQKSIYFTLKLFEMRAESSSLIAQMDVDEAAIDEGLYSRQL
jgi:hypothetical protein